MLAFALALVAALLHAQPGVAAGSPPAGAAAKPASPGPLHVESTWAVGGEGGWDLLIVDPETGRLFLPRGTHVMVIDTKDGKVVGDIAGTDGVHGGARVGKGFTSNGRAGTVTVFDLASLKTLQTVKVGENPDAILFEPTTKRVLAFNARSKDATVINAEDGTVVGTIALGGKPELAVHNGVGKVYLNLEDTSEVLTLDPREMKVERRAPLAPGEEPTGLAIDPVHHRLFAACGNEKMVVMDEATGKVLATPAIGKGVDGAEFDAAGGYAVSSNGDGTLTVVAAQGDSFTVAQTLPTATRARTVAINPKTRRLYLPTAEFEAPKEAPKDAPARPARPAMKPGSFKIIVVAP